MICNNDYVTIWLYKNNARQRFHNNINVNRKCTRKDLWDGDICDYAAQSSGFSFAHWPATGTGLGLFYMYAQKTRAETAIVIDLLGL